MVFIAITIAIISIVTSVNKTLANIFISSSIFLIVILTQSDIISFPKSTMSQIFFLANA